MMARSRSLRRLIGILGVASLLAACGRESSKTNSFGDALSRVSRVLPASGYSTNEFIPSSAPPHPAGLTKLKVGMAWIMNDEQAAWYVGLDKGFFKDAGLDIEIVPGGPGKDSLRLLAGGALDIATAEAGSFVVKLASSRTGADIVAVGTELKHSPYCWLAIDNSVPRTTASRRKIEPKDLMGAKVGMQPGYDYILDFLSYKYGLPRNGFRDSRAGFTPDPLVLGVVDYYSAWINNQPGLLEDEGYKNWCAFKFADWGLEDYASVTVVRRSMIRQHPEVVRSYLFALGRSIQFVLDHPDDAAEITVRMCDDTSLRKFSVLRRFHIERELIEGSDGQPLQYMSAGSWDSLAALLLLSGQIELPR